MAKVIPLCGAFLVLSTAFACGSEGDGAGASGAGGTDAGAGGVDGGTGGGGGGAGGTGATGGTGGTGATGGGAAAGGGGGAGGGTGGLGGGGGGSGGTGGAAAPGRFIVYRADASTDDVFELYAVDLAGSSPSPPIKLNAPLASGGDVLGFSWSPDGTKLAYLADQDTDGVEEIYFVDMSTAVPGSPVKLNGALIPKGKSRIEVWSANSVGLVFSAQATSDLVYELFYVDTTQKPPKAERLHAPKGSGSVSFPQFAPGSDKIGFLADLQTSGTIDLQVVDLTKPAPYLAVRVNPALPSGIDMQDFSWSPDGKALTAVSGANDSNHLELIDVSASVPGAPVVLSSTGANKFFADVASRPTWLPDGSGVLYTQDIAVNNRYELFFVGINAGTPVAPIRMHAPLAIGRVWNFQVSPDSKRVAYRAETDGTSVEAWVVDTTGPTPKIGVKVAEEKTQLGWSGMEITSNSKWLLLHVDDQLYGLDISAQTLGTPTQLNATLPVGDKVTGFDVESDGSGLVYRAGNPTNGTWALWWVSLGASAGAPAGVTSGAGPTGIEPEAQPLRADGTAVAFRAGSNWDLHVVSMSPGPSGAPTKVSGALPAGAFVLPGVAFGK